MSTYYSDTRPGKKLLFSALLSGIGGAFHFGYQVTLTNPAQYAFTTFVNQSYHDHFGVVLDKAGLDAIWGFLVAVLFAGGIVGSLTLRFFADWIGRKKALLLSFFGILASSLLSIGSYFINSFELYGVSRFTMGVSVSMALGMSGLFLTECSPKGCRGMVCMTTGIFVQLGLFLGSIIGMPDIFGDVETWWIIYLAEVLVVSVVMLLFSFYPESPCYLLFKGYEESARDSVKLYYNCPDYLVDKHVKELKDNIQNNTRSMNIIQVLRDPQTRRATIVGATTAFAMGFSGVAVINAFAVEILRNTGLSIFQASIANAFLSLSTLIGALFSASIIDKHGRRPLLLRTVMAIVAINIAIFALMRAYNVYHAQWLGYCLIGAILLFFIAFTIGPGPLCYFITSEMIGQHARSAGQSWAAFVQMASRTVILIFYLPLSNAIGSDYSYAILFVLPMLYCFVFFYYFLPETKNRNLMEVEAEIQKLPRLPCSAHQTYSTDNAQQEYDRRDLRQVF
ncbi:unnamed protein product [Bursaphelenchus okinawaensis]|uniref:Major facilitator superfamily (MFS) profile domain-containing protein n=1 Tax=Bursaphelenchus okinawaensis TaxID=465554 RepID=A0A811KHP9_9BILA|nr:unnamed protein product [Bursaphelenchus okinawaensis]CAG9103475.1 unnamed protein product [Bursaphelenchus okinawaensis]